MSQPQESTLDPWYKRPLDVRAPLGGEKGVDGLLYKAGEFMPFYIPRPLMPQVEHHDLNKFIQFVRSNGVWLRRAIYHPNDLHNHQRVNWDPNRYNLHSKDFPVLIGKDKFILDGNHRWYRHLKLGGMVTVIQIGLSFEPAIELLFKFPKTSTGEK